MTTKVVKGSIWTLAGQVAPLAVSLVTTPFVIRMLGAEGYGVLILIGLIPAYLGFADFGMSMASTKFASEAYAEGDLEKEARIVRTAALIALVVSLPVAAGLIAFAFQILAIFNVPEHFHVEAAMALRIAAVTLVVNFMCGIFNTPQITRLRMDLNTFINAGTRILGLIAIPIVLYLGLGIIGAVTMLLAASALNLFGQIAVGIGLLPKLRSFSVERSMLRPIVRFGLGLTGASLAFLALSYLDKGLLPAIAGVKNLAYYTVAFTFAGLFSMFSQSMTQSLLPAFSRLTTPENSVLGSALYSRSIRLNAIAILPALAILAVVAKPFITLWAGQDFGEMSVGPLYILLIGLLFNLPAYLPLCAIISHGRTGVLANLYLLELIPYSAALVVLTGAYGIMGTAAAWSLRSLVDSVALFILANRVTGFYAAASEVKVFWWGGIVLLPPIFLVIVNGEPTIMIVSILAVCLLAYSVIVWKKLLISDETNWILGRLNRLT